MPSLEGGRGFERILDRLEQAIGDGALAAGDRLPPERELAARFGVSRTSVREALRVLEALGVVRVRRGAEHGVTILEEPTNALVHLLRLHLALRHVSVEELVEFRILVESWAAGALARAGSGEAAAELEELVERMAVATQSSFNELDAAFHLVLVRGSRNELATLIADGSRGATGRTMLEAMLGIRDWPGQRERLVAEHRAIALAVARGDEQAASRLVAEHISGFWNDHLRRRAGA